MKRLISLIILGILIIPLKAQVKENENYIDSMSLKVVGIKEELIKIQDNYYAIISHGSAGNIGVFVSENGVILIDDQFATLSKRIKELLSTITQKPVKAVINTHYHYDHTNGNIAFGSEKIPIIAHNNARLRMSEKQVMPTWFNAVQKPYPPEALPVLTFTDTLTLYEGNEIIELTHFKNAHSDGDIVVHFKNADIYHTGDIFVNYGLPHIDEAAGGDIYGMIEAVDQLLLKSNEKTKFIPGHGPVSSIKELKEYRNLLSTVRDNIEALTRENRKIDEIIKDTNMKIQYKNKGIETYIAGWDDKFIEQVYRSVKRHLSTKKI
jgi:cyclase